MKIFSLNFFLKCILLYTILTDKTWADFSASFQNFLNQNFPPNVVQLLNAQSPNRHFDSTTGQMANNGHFGGGNHQAGTPTKNTPVVFVHGATEDAGWMDQLLGTYFRSRGYDDSELYSTTWGSARSNALMSEKIECAHVKKTRYLIEAVSNFTGNGKVNVVGHSMGAPIGRKAILGGQCVDTGEQLGPPLSDKIRVFLSAAGANWGSAQCTQFGAQFMAVCNALNGLSCNSAFMRDVNSKSNYEGEFVFTISSNSDNIIGYSGCGHLLSQIAGATGNFQLPGISDHSSIMQSERSKQLQFQLISNPSGNAN